MNKTVIKISLCLFLIPTLFSEARGQIRLTVLPFVSRSNEVSSRQASQVTEMIIRGLHSSPSILLTERERLRTVVAEQGFNLSSGVFDQDTAAKIGGIIGCQYILFGSVMQITDRYLTDSFFLSGKSMKETSAVIEARIIDVATRRIVLSVSETGSFTEILKERVQSSNHRKAALEIAASRLCDRVRAVLADEYPAIISVSKNKIRINRGKNSGVNIGMLYRVYQEAEELSDFKDQSLEKRIINLAILRVISVNDGFSTVEVLDNRPVPTKTENKKSGKSKKTKKNNDVQISGLIREGDKIEVVSFSEAGKLKLATHITPSQKTAHTTAAKRKPVKFDRSKFEMSSTDTKKVIKSYGLDKKEEKSLLEAHSKAEKMIGARKKYEAYMKLAQSTLYDYLASYNAAKYALELSMLKEAEEWADKTLLINPEYEPAKALMTKIKRRR